jgi:hypothetical protein
MDMHDLIDMALANVDERRIELMMLEPGDVSVYAVPGLGQIVSDLIGVIGGADAGRMSASWEGETYLIAISWSGGETAIGILDRLVQDVELSLAMASVARTARIHGIGVRFFPGPEAVTAQIAVPGSIVARSRPADPPSTERREELPFIPHELERRVAVPTASWLDESEAFLERVFAPLRMARTVPSATGDGLVLQVRVPGERFTDVADDSPSTMAAEAAVEIRSALSTFDEGRRSAQMAG